MNEHDRSKLCDEVVARFRLPEAATHQDACRRVGVVMSEILDATVELRFVTIRSARLSGATVRHRDEAGTWQVVDGQPVGLDLAALIADHQKAARDFA